MMPVSTISVFMCVGVFFRWAIRTLVEANLCVPDGICQRGTKCHGRCSFEVQGRSGLYDLNSKTAGWRQEVYGRSPYRTTCQYNLSHIKYNLRPTDIIARYGGEEFVALLPRTPLDTLTQITHRLNAAVREQPIVYNRINIFVTISIGATMLTAESHSLDELLTQADQAMYHAKAAGRNCTVVFNSSRFEGTPENK